MASATPPLHDLICVGLNCSSLAVATAIADKSPKQDLLILESGPSFTWGQEEPPLAGGKMETPFFSDLITTSNPRSFFTFVNFLHQKKRLAAWTNVSSFRPLRLDMDDYLRWVVAQLESLGWVSYGQKVTRVEPIRQSPSSRVHCFAVHHIDSKTGKRCVDYSRKVLVAPQPTSAIPAPLSGAHLRPLVASPATYQRALRSLTSALPNVAIIGATQQAAEIFEALQTFPPGRSGCTATWFAPQSVLRPLEASPFVHRASHDPASRLAAYPPDMRHVLAHGVERKHRFELELLERLYDAQYARRVVGDERYKIALSASVVGAEMVGGGRQVRLLVRDDGATTAEKAAETTTTDAFDLLVVVPEQGSGASEAAALLTRILPLTEDGKVALGADYRVQVRKDALQRDCGLWVLGTLAPPGSHDEAFTWLAEVGRRVAASVSEVAAHAGAKGEEPLVSSVL